MKVAKKLLPILLALTMLLTTLAACGDSGNGSSSSTPQSSSGNGEGTGSNGGEAPSGTSAVDTSEQVNLVVYTFAGASPRDMDMVNQAASEITLESINATVDVQVMADWGTRYNLALTSGEPIDLIWTAMWYSYQPYAFDGAWLDITNLVDEVAPALKTIIGEDRWEISKIAGSNYAIPSSKNTWNQWGVTWREDLRKKYDLPEIVDWETMEAYAEGILENEPGMIPYCDSPSGGLWHSFSEKNHYYVGLGNPQFSYGLGVSTDDPYNLFVFHETEEFKDFLITQRRWVENGYVQPDVANSTDQGPTGMLSGKYAGYLSGLTSAVLSSVIVPARDSHPDWEIGYMNYGEMFQWTYLSHPTMMGFALPSACPNPERTLLFVQELLSNNDLFQLYDMGIEGTHYEIDENGYYVSINDPINPGYLQGSSGLTNYIYNGDAKVYSEDYQWVLDYEKNHMEPYEVTNYFEGFAEDYTAYNALVTAISEVNTQYFWPLLRGAVADVDAGLADLLQKLASAGRQEVVDNVIEQYHAYLEAMGVPKV